MTLVDGPLYQRLIGTAGTALYASRVYKELAPEGEPMPYLVFYQASFQLDNDTPTRGFHATYTVECVAESQAEARQGAGYIDEALNGQALTLADGWVNYWLATDKARARTETVERKQFYRAGFDFDIRGSK